MANVESGTYEVSRGLSALELEEACKEVERALAEAVACLYFLAELTTGEPANAVSDAHLALLRIRNVVDGLREGYPHAARSESQAAGSSRR
jgi:hypothetical protein